jgi:hypothetical protein
VRSRPEVGQREARVGVDDRGQVDAREVMPLGHHLRADQHRPVGGAKALDRLAQRARLRCGVCVETDALELRQLAAQLRLEALRAGADLGELRRPADGARHWHRLPVTAVMAVEAVVAVQRQRDVAEETTP